MLEFFLHWNAKGGKISPTGVIHYRDYKAACISILFNEVSLFTPDCLKCFLPLRCKRLTEYCCHPAGQAWRRAGEGIKPVSGTVSAPLYKEEQEPHKMTSSCSLWGWNENLMSFSWSSQMIFVQLDWLFGATDHQNGQVDHWHPLLFTHESRFTEHV